jgi:hypothetical protein
MPQLLLASFVSSFCNRLTRACHADRRIEAERLASMSDGDGGEIVPETLPSVIAAGLDEYRRLDRLARQQAKAAGVLASYKPDLDALREELERHALIFDSPYGERFEHDAMLSAAKLVKLADRLDADLCAIEPAKGETKAEPKKRGRKQQFDTDDDLEFVDRWEKARDRGTPFVDFCRDGQHNGIGSMSQKEGEQIKARTRMARKRRAKQCQNGGRN